jgi:hypothetical protein
VAIGGYRWVAASVPASPTTGGADGAGAADGVPPSSIPGARFSIPGGVFRSKKRGIGEAFRSVNAVGGVSEEPRSAGASSFAHEEQPAVVDPTSSAAAMHLEIFTFGLRISRTTNHVVTLHVPLCMTGESRGDNFLTLSARLVLSRQIAKKDEALRQI